MAPLLSVCRVGAPWWFVKYSATHFATIKAYTRDSIGRQNKATLSGGSFAGSYTRSYDAEDRLVSHTFTTYTTPSLRPDCVGNDLDDAKYTGSHTYAWGPNGHPIKMDGETLHWDGNTLLYTSNTAGTVDSVKTGLLADSNPGNGENVVYDRDDSGDVVSNHNGAGFSGWTPPDAYGQRCAAGAPPSSSTYAAAYVNSTFSPVNMPASDGITDGYNVVQGRHGYDPKTAQWISNDAMPEIVGDPFSGKPLLWNRNNPLLFTDPTGLDGSINNVPYTGDATCSNPVYATTPGSGCTNLPSIANVTSCSNPALPPCGDFTASDQSAYVSAYNYISGLNVALGFAIPGGEEIGGAEVGVDIGENIFGRYYTEHALGQMQSRGLVPSVVEETIQNGTRTAGQTPYTFVYDTSEARVVTNEYGDVVTAINKVGSGSSWRW